MTESFTNGSSRDFQKTAAEAGGIVQTKRALRPCLRDVIVLLDANSSGRCVIKGVPWSRIPDAWKEVASRSVVPERTLHMVV